MLFRVFVGMSVDGFIATPDKAPAWGDQFDPRAYGYDEFIQHIAVVVIGRTTFDQVLGFDEWPWKGRRVEVLTSRPLPADVPDGVIARHDGLEAFLARLRAEGLTRDVWVMGGPRMIQSFRARGALDRIEIILLPVVLGDGIPLFNPEMASLTLRLERQRVFADGAVELVYAPA
jgi:dihydrofolate reductase